MAPSAISTPTQTQPTSSCSTDAELQLLQKLEAPLKNLPRLAQAFEDVFHELALTSASQFLPTPVRVLPNGDETGRFLAMDLGGTNLRVGVVELYGEDPPSENGSYDEEDIEEDGSAGGGRLKITTQGSWNIPEYLKSSAAENLFSWVAEKIGDVVSGYLDAVDTATREITLVEGMELGITFSFPMEQTSHKSAIIMPMGKGFTFTGTNNLSTLLSQAYAAHVLTYPSLPSISITSITNDSISTLLSAAYVHAASNKRSRAAAGIIAGTGTNATCLCPVSKLHPSKRPSVGPTMLVNTEWSISGTLPPLEPYLTEWDRHIDAANEKPGFQPFEEMVGGRYLGELVRLVALDVFAAHPCRLPAKIQRPYGVDTKLCADVEAASSDSEALELLQGYFSAEEVMPAPWDLQTASTFRRICGKVSTRAAALVAAATVGVLGVNDELTGDYAEIVVGYTGTVLEKYPGFKERCEEFMREIVSRRADTRGKTIKLVEAKDGGILGAAVLAAMVKEGRT